MEEDEGSTQEYDYEEKPDATSQLSMPEFKIKQSLSGYVRPKSAPKTGTINPIDKFITVGELAKERNATKWYIPEHCITVDVKCEFPNSDVAPGYFYDCLDRVGGKGTYIITNKKTWNDWTTFQFDRNSFCPICQIIHDSYGFEYKLKKDVYGGFKCWRTNDWVTSYSFKEMNLFQ